MQDIRQYFGTDGIRGTVGQFPISPDFMLKLGWAIGKVLGGEHGKVVIGKDTRISGYMIESALEAGLSAAGEDILLLGPMPTPGIAYLTRTLRAQAGIVISASHNPFCDNGIKFFNDQGKKLADEVERRIEWQLKQPMTTVTTEKLGRASRVDDAATRYIEFCKNTFPQDRNLQGIKIILDCANGANYQIAPAVFRELGARIVETFVSPDGLNINENCGAANVQALQRDVIAKKADLGIAFDGDGDRVIMIDHHGEVVDGDELLFIIARHLQLQNLLVNGVVGTAMTNLGVEFALQRLTIPFYRSRVGDKYVLQTMLKHQCLLGGESSGHLICLDKATTGDGIVAALQVLAAMLVSNKDLATLRRPIEKFPQTMINIKVADKSLINNCKVIEDCLQSIQAKLGKQGRVLLRPSGTEALIRVMVEGKNQHQVEAFAVQLAEVVRYAASA